MPERVSYPSGEHRSLFSEIVGHPTNIEGNPTSIEAHPAQIEMYLSGIGVRSQTPKEVWQTWKLIWHKIKEKLYGVKIIPAEQFRKALWNSEIF